MRKFILYPALYRRGTGCCSLQGIGTVQKSTVLDSSQTGRSRESHERMRAIFHVE